MSSERQDLLQAGCGLAFAARKSYPEDLRATLVPDGLAKANGTTVDKVLADARKSLAEQRAAALARAQPPATGGKPDPQLQAAADKMADAMTGYFLDAAGDVAELRLLLSLDESKGLGSTIEAVPRPDSELGRRLATQQAYTVDPALLAEPPPGAVFALGSLRPYADLMKMMQQLMVDTAANDKERDDPEAVAGHRDRPPLAGPMSGRFDLHPGGQAPGPPELPLRLSVHAGARHRRQGAAGRLREAGGRPLDEAPVRPGGQRHEAEAVGQPPERASPPTPWCSGCPWTRARCPPS